MWRKETGFLEMFLSYYWQFERHSTSARGYRNFLYDILSLHERVQAQHKNATTSLEDASLEDIEPVDINNDMSYQEPPPPPPQKETDKNTGRRTPRVKQKSSDPEWLPAKRRKRVAVAQFVSDASSPSTNITPVDSMKISKSICVFPFQTKKSPQPEKSPQSTNDFASSPQSADNALVNCNNDSIPFARESPYVVPSSIKEPEVQRCRYFCTYCDLVFATGDELREHSRTHRGDRPFYCTKCPRTFIAASALRRHQSLHSADRPYACNFCEKAFVSVETMKRHESAVHDHRPSYVCTICNKKFRSARNLSRHEALHRNERPFQCQYCDKAFVVRSHLRTHERSHTGDNPYKCNQCPKTFYNRSHCIAHMRVHNNERPFHCKLCGRSFRMIWFFKKHNCNPNKRRRKAEPKIEVSETNKQSEEKVNEQSSVPATACETPTSLSKKDSLENAHPEDSESGNQNPTTTLTPTSNLQPLMLVNVSSELVSSNSKTLSVKHPDVTTVTTLPKVLSDPALPKVLSGPASTYRVVRVPSKASVTPIASSTSDDTPQSLEKDVKDTIPSVALVPSIPTVVATSVLAQSVETPPIISKIYSEGKPSEKNSRRRPRARRGRAKGSRERIIPANRPLVNIAPKPYVICPNPYTQIHHPQPAKRDS